MDGQPTKVALLQTKTINHNSATGLDTDVATFVRALKQEKLIAILYAAAYNGTAVDYSCMIVYTT